MATGIPLRDHLDVVENHLASTAHPTEDEKNLFLRSLKAIEIASRDGSMPRLYATRARDLLPKAKNRKWTYAASTFNEEVKSKGEEPFYDDAKLAEMLGDMYEENEKYRR